MASSSSACSSSTSYKVMNNILNAIDTVVNNSNGPGYNYGSDTDSDNDTDPTCPRSPPALVPKWKEPLILDLTITNFQETIRRILDNKSEDEIESLKIVGTDLAWYYLSVSPSVDQSGNLVLYCCVNVDNATSREIFTKGRFHVTTLTQFFNGVVNTKIVEKDDLMEIYAQPGSVETIYDYKISGEFENVEEFSLQVAVRTMEWVSPNNDMSLANESTIHRGTFGLDRVMEIKKELYKFANAIREFSKNGIYTPQNEDIKLKSGKTGPEYAFHKDLLKAQGGSVLRIKLFTEMKEPIIEMDASDDVLRGFKSYIYYGGIPDLAQRPEEYFDFASKYNIELLKELAEITMVQKLTERTFGKFHRVAKLYETTHLRQEMIAFAESKPSRTFKMFDNNFDRFTVFQY